MHWYLQWTVHIKVNHSNTFVKPVTCGVKRASINVKKSSFVWDNGSVNVFEMLKLHSTHPCLDVEERICQIAFLSKDVQNIWDVHIYNDRQTKIHKNGFVQSFVFKAILSISIILLMHFWCCCSIKPERKWHILNIIQWFFNIHRYSELNVILDFCCCSCYNS